MELQEEIKLLEKKLELLKQIQEVRVKLNEAVKDIPPYTPQYVPYPVYPTYPPYFEPYRYEPLKWTWTSSDTAKVIQWTTSNH